MLLSLLAGLFVSAFALTYTMGEKQNIYIIKRQYHINVHDKLVSTDKS